LLAFVSPLNSYLRSLNARTVST